MIISRRLWTEREVKRAKDMRAAGYSYPTIDKALGRRDGSTQQRLEIAGHGSGDQVKSFRAPDYLLAERDALAAARERKISVAIRRPVTRRFTEKQGCDSARSRLRL